MEIRCEVCSGPISGGKGRTLCRSCAAKRRWQDNPRPLKRPFVVFEGLRYFRQADGYWRASRHGGNELLHRAVWKSHNKRDIPDGWHIHHRDEDKANNSPDNLEAIPSPDHSRHHHPDGVFAPGREAVCVECASKFLARWGREWVCSDACRRRRHARNERERRAGLQPSR